jgi:hypothetical protein
LLSNSTHILYGVDSREESPSQLLRAIRFAVKVPEVLDWVQYTNGAKLRRHVLDMTNCQRTSWHNAAPAFVSEANISAHEHLVMRSGSAIRDFCCRDPLAHQVRRSVSSDEEYLMKELLHSSLFLKGQSGLGHGVLLLVLPLMMGNLKKGSHHCHTTGNLPLFLAS